MNELIYVRQETLDEVTNSGQFLPSLLLTENARKAIATGQVQVRKGQWMIDGKTGERGQFIGVKKNVLGQTSIRMRRAQPGMTFKDYQQKLAA